MLECPVSADSACGCPGRVCCCPCPAADPDFVRRRLLRLRAGSPSGTDCPEWPAPDTEGPWELACAEPLRDALRRLRLALPEPGMELPWFPAAADAPLSYGVSPCSGSFTDLTTASREACRSLKTLSRFSLTQLYQRARLSPTPFSGRTFRPPPPPRRPYPPRLTPPSSSMPQSFSNTPFASRPVLSISPAHRRARPARWGIG